MSENFIRKPTAVKAWQYNKQPQNEWPSWVRDFEVATTMGLQRIGAGPGILLVPTKGGVTHNVPVGDWIVVEFNTLAVVKGGDFEERYRPESVQEVEEAAAGEPAETAPVPEVVIEAAAQKVAAADAAEATPAKKPAKTAAVEPAAEAAPAAEPAAIEEQ